MRGLTKTIGATAFAVVTASSPAFAADVVVGLQNWPSAAATAHVIKAVIEENLGLEVELQNGTNPIIFEAMDRGSMDVMPEVWLPNQQNLYDAYVVKKDAVVLNPNGVPAEQGLCVPTYVAKELGVTSVYDLTDPGKAVLFDSDGDGKGNLWVGSPGDASGNVEKIKAKSYGYDQSMETEVYDETVAYANLANATNAHKPWVGFCYSPHYIFTLYDLTMLEEPPYDASKWNVIQPTDDPAWLKKSSAPVAWPTAHVHIAYRKALATKMPEVANLLRNIKFTADEINDMSYALVVDKKAPDAFAKEWVMKHEAEVLGWIAQ